MSKRLDKKNVLVTGGLRGIGRAVANRFSAEGATVLITDLDSPSQAKALLGEDQHTYFQTDISKEADWKKLLADITPFGHLDCLVNNAGIDCVGAVTDISYQAWRHIMSVNVDGPFLGVKHCHDLLAKGGAISQHGSTIINVSSIMGKVGYIDTSAYNTSKGAITLFTKAIALEFASKKTPIRVNSIHPGFVHTPLFDAGMKRLEAAGFGAPDAIAEQIGHMTPMGRVASPDEIANAILFLASDESSYMTGSELVIDGGWTAQ